MNIGNKIKNRRKELGLTQADLAEPEFTRGFISQIENGITKPPLKTLEIIATKLAVSVNYLIDEESEISINFSNQNKVLEQIKIAKRLIHLKKYKDAFFIIETIEKGTNKEFIGEVLELKGFIFYDQQQYKETIPLLEEALIYLTPQNPIILLEVYLKLAASYMNLQKYDKAIDYGFYGLCIFQSGNHEDRLFELKLLYTLAYCHCRRNEYKQGLRFIEEAILISDSTQIHYNYGSLKMLRGLAHTYLKDYEKAIRSTKEALHFFKSSNSLPEIVGCLTNLGIIYRYINEYDQSINFLEQSLKKAKEKNLDFHIQNNLYELAATVLLSCRYEKALSIAEGGLQLIQDEKLRGKILYILGSTHTFLKNWAEAIAYLRQALKLLEKNNMKRWEAKSLTKLAEVYHLQGEHQSSYIYNQQALCIYESLMGAE